MISGHEHRVYLGDVTKIFKRAQKGKTPIPPFHKCSTLRKISLETCADDVPYFEMSVQPF